MVLPLIYIYTIKIFHNGKTSATLPKHAKGWLATTTIRLPKQDGGIIDVCDSSFVFISLFHGAKNRINHLLIVTFHNPKSIETYIYEQEKA